MFKKILVALALGGSHIVSMSPAIAAETPVVAAAPAKLKLAEEVVMQLVPPGTFKRMMDEIANGGLIEEIMSMDMGELMGMMGPEVAGAEGAEAMKGQTLMDLAGEKDPHFKERLDIMSKVMFQELGTLLVKIEPEVRTAMAKIYARKFDDKQLADMSGFFATPSGTAFAKSFMMSTYEKEMLGASMKSIPVLIEGMPAIMKKVEAATAHLPALKSPGQDVADAATDAAAAAGDAAMAAGSEESGTEPWYDRENWTAADKKRIAILETTSGNAMNTYLDFEMEATNRSRESYMKKGWKPAAKEASAEEAK